MKILRLVVIFLPIIGNLHSYPLNILYSVLLRSYLYCWYISTAGISISDIVRFCNYAGKFATNFENFSFVTLSRVVKDTARRPHVASTLSKCGPKVIVISKKILPVKILHTFITIFAYKKNVHYLLFRYVLE